MSNLRLHGVHHEVAKGALAELVARLLALPLPLFAVRVEDAMAEEVHQHAEGALALGVVLEVGLEHVFDVGGVGGDDTSDLPRAPEGHRVGGTVDEDVGDPVEKSVPVFEELGKETEQGVGLEASASASLRPAPVEKEEAEGERQEEEAD